MGKLTQRKKNVHRKRRKSGKEKGKGKGITRALRNREMGYREPFEKERYRNFLAVQQFGQDKKTWFQVTPPVPDPFNDVYREAEYARPPHRFPPPLPPPTSPARYVIDPQTGWIKKKKRNP